MGLAACAIAHPTTYFNGTAHYEQILKSNFTGASGNIVLDPSTGSRDPSSAYFQLLNFVERRDAVTGKITFEPVQTDMFRNGEWTNLAPYIYGDGTNNRPPPLPVVEVDENHISAALRGTGLALSSLVILLTLAITGWTFWRKDSKVVIASQPIFLRLICAGVLLMGSAMIPLSVDDKISSVRGCDIACMFTPWLFVLGFALSFAALFSKTLRINKIFHNPSLKRIKVTPKDVMPPLIVLVAVNVLVLSLWSGLDPLRWQREVTGTDVFGQVTETMGKCESDSFAAFVSVLGVVNIAVVVIAAYQDYCARDIALEFSESSYIGRAIGLFLLACLYGFPVLIITWDDPSARYFVLLLLCFVCSMSILLLIFVPKIMFDRRGDGMRKISHIVAKSKVVGKSNGTSMWTDATGAFVSGMSFSETHHADEDDSEDQGGVRIVDRGRAREELTRQNRKLHEERHELAKRVKHLETASIRNLSYTPGPMGEEAKVEEMMDEKIPSPSAVDAEQSNALKDEPEE